MKHIPHALVLPGLLFLGMTLLSAAHAQTPFLDRPTLWTWDGAAHEPLAPRSERPLVGDRPDFTEATSVVGRGVTQFEMGYTYTREDGPQPRESHTYPELVMRMGVIAEWAELRLLWSAAEEQEGLGSSPAVGSEDLTVGMKIALTQQIDWLPETVFIAHLQLPTGSADFTADEILPSGAYIYGWELNDSMDYCGADGAQPGTRRRHGRAVSRSCAVLDGGSIDHRQHRELCGMVLHHAAWSRRESHRVVHRRWIYISFAR
jgi:hypothetical protein